MKDILELTWMADGPSTMVVSKDVVETDIIGCGRMDDLSSRGLLRVMSTLAPLSLVCCAPVTVSVFPGNPDTSGTRDVNGWKTYILQNTCIDAIVNYLDPNHTPENTEVHTTKNATWFDTTTKKTTTGKLEIPKSDICEMAQSMLESGTYSWLGSPDVEESHCVKRMPVNSEQGCNIYEVKDADNQDIRCKRIKLPWGSQINEWISKEIKCGIMWDCWLSHQNKHDGTCSADNYMNEIIPSNRVSTSNTWWTVNDDKIYLLPRPLGKDGDWEVIVSRTVDTPSGDDSSPLEGTSRLLKRLNIDNKTVDEVAQIEATQSESHPNWKTWKDNHFLYFADVNNETGLEEVGSVSYNDRYYKEFGITYLNAYEVAGVTYRLERFNNLSASLKVLPSGSHGIPWVPVVGTTVSKSKEFRTHTVLVYKLEPAMFSKSKAHVMEKIVKLINFSGDTILHVSHDNREHIYVWMDSVYTTLSDCVRRIDITDEKWKLILYNSLRCLQDIHEAEFSHDNVHPETIMVDKNFEVTMIDPGVKSHPLMPLPGVDAVVESKPKHRTSDITGLAKAFLKVWYGTPDMPDPTLEDVEGIPEDLKMVLKRMMKAQDDGGNAKEMMKMDYFKELRGLLLQGEVEP